MTNGFVIFVSTYHEILYVTPLPQMTSTDKDFRFMATNDLMVELQKDSIKLDDDSERKVTIIITTSLPKHDGDY